jgi:mRNA-degrading endonuclease toxin of MazEF toxin-antitoxin module
LGERRLTRGEIRWYTFCLPDKRRPVLILTRNEVIDHLNEIVVAPATLEWDWSPSADASTIIQDAPGVTVNTGGVPLRHGEMTAFRTLAAAVDRHLRVFVQVEGNGLWATMAPVGFGPLDPNEDPPIRTEPDPDGLNPNCIHVAAAEQAKKLIFSVPPTYP